MKRTYSLMSLSDADPDQLSSDSDTDTGLYLKVVVVRDDAIIPRPILDNGNARKNVYELYSVEETLLIPYTWTLVKTGLSLELPVDYYAVISGRPELHGPDGNLENFIDVDIVVFYWAFRDELQLGMLNNSDHEFKVEKGWAIGKITVEQLSRTIHL